MRGFGLNRDVTAAARQAGFQAQCVAERGIPYAVEQQLACETRARHLRAGQQFNPGHGQAGEFAGSVELAGAPAHGLPGERGL